MQFTSNIENILLNGNYHFVMTGASGWIGRSLLHMLRNYYQDRVYDNVSLYASTNKKISLLDGSIYYCQPLSELNNLSVYKDKEVILYHGSYLTKDKVSIYGIDEYRNINSSISEIVGNFISGNNIKGMIYPSSGAVYDLDPEDRGSFDRNPYGAAKIRDEEEYKILCSERGTKLVIPRTYNLSGNYIENPAYMLYDILTKINNDDNIHIKSKHKVIRSFTYLGDYWNIVLNSLFDLFNTSKNCLVYDTASKELIEIEKLCYRCMKVLNMEVKVFREFDELLTEDFYVGNFIYFNFLAHKYGVNLMNLDDQIFYTNRYLAR